MVIDMLIDTATNADFIKEAINNYTDHIDSPTDDSGTTLLILAVKSERISVVDKLLLKCADMNKQDLDGNTPLHHAFMMGFQDVVHVLIQSGADESIENREGRLPWELRWAILLIK